MDLGTSPSCRKGRILIIDDDPAVTALMDRVLQSEHDVVVERDPRLALRALASGEAFDLILCDVSMPQMSGIELYEALRGTSPDATRKLVLMSGGGLDEAEEEFLASAGVCNIDKPFTPRELRAFVRDFVG
jgi:CheY-like chemotaxis protein